MKRMMGVAAMAVMAVSVAACGNAPDTAACKAAMKADYARALSSGVHATEPPSCKGLSSAELATLAGQVLGGQ